MKEYILDFIQSNEHYIIKIALRLLASLFIIQICHKIAVSFSKKLTTPTGQFRSIDPMVIPMLRRGIRYIVYAIGIAIVLAIFGVSSASIVAVLGALGLGIGLALKETLGNIAAGMLLLLLRPFRPEHLIECAGVTGTVKHIDLFVTALETIDGLYVSMPNLILISNPIKNFTYNGKRRMDLVVSISYKDSINDGLDALRAIIAEEKRFLLDPPAEVMVQSMADSAVNLQLRAWTSVEDYWQTYWDTLKKMKEYIEAAGLTIPFPQRDLHVITSPDARPTLPPMHKKGDS